MPDNRQKLAVLGSTGSIGEQTLQVVRDNPELLGITVLTSNRNWQRLADQAIEFRPDSVVIADKTHYKELSEKLQDEPVKVYAGGEALRQIVRNSEIDTVVNALVGYAGLEPTVSSLEAGKKLALANKESLVVAGELIMKLSLDNRAPIIPVDSEHSAIFQCLAGETSAIRKIILTASGGPFWKHESGTLENVTPEQALSHPVWKMGDKISMDSSTMMNKGFEVIEARWLFGVDASDIEVVVHPQSIVHSFVEFADGVLKAQLGFPDMRVPIQYALTFPHRLPVTAERFSITEAGSLEFFTPDMEKFPCLGLAYQALREGGNAGCVLNAANEVAVRAFLDRKIGFGDIPRIIKDTMRETQYISQATLDDLRETNREAVRIATSKIQ